MMPIIFTSPWETKNAAAMPASALRPRAREGRKLDGIIRPVVDRVFPFASTNEAMAYVERGRAKGKVVISNT